MNHPVAEAVAAGEAVDVPNGNEPKKGNPRTNGVAFLYLWLKVYQLLKQNKVYDKPI